MFMALVIDAGAGEVAPADASTGEDLSAVFTRGMQERDPILPEIAIFENGLFVLFVPGMISDNNIQSADYFLDFGKLLTRLGLKEDDDYVLLSKRHGFDSENSVTLNAKAISDFVGQNDRKIVLITHSKGSVDALAALIENKDIPEVGRKIHAWLNIQGSIWGTPMADAIGHSGIAKLVADVGLALFGGSGQALTDMTLVTRHKFMNDHWDEVNQLSRDIKVLSFASSKDYEQMDRSIKTLYRSPFIGPVVAQAMKDQVHDGLVPTSHVLLPGGAFVIAADIDHADSVTNTDRDEYRFDRSQMSLVLLRLLLR